MAYTISRPFSLDRHMPGHSFRISRRSYRHTPLSTGEQFCRSQSSATCVYLSSIRSTLGAIIINFLRYLMTSVTNFDSLMYYKDILWKRI
jgi:hypothetical protein